MPETQQPLAGRSWAVSIIRWMARIVSLLLGVILLLFMIGEGPPPWYVLLPCLAVLAGFGVGWKYEALGAAIILGMFVYFNAIEYRANGHLLRFGAFHLLLLPGLAFLFCWIADRRSGNPRTRADSVPPQS